MTPNAVPPEAKQVAAQWLKLTQMEHLGRFESSSVADLPEPAARWLRHAIADGTPLLPSVQLVMDGEIKLGAWRRFSAVQVIAPSSGYIWAARTRMFGLPVSGFDRYGNGEGEMQWRLARLVPVMSASGSDVARSAAGRLAGEFILVPTAFPGAVAWSTGSTQDAVRVTWRVGEENETVELTIGAGGELRSACLQRWGNPDRAAYQRHPFGVTVECEARFGGVTIPREFRAGWWWGSDRWPEGEFFRARVTDATFSA